jgi:hypothetical protein
LVPVIIGIKVATTPLDCVVRTTSEPWPVPNDEDDETGVTALLAWRPPLAPYLVVLGASGGGKWQIACRVADIGLRDRDDQVTGQDRRPGCPGASAFAAVVPCPRPLPHAAQQALAAQLARPLPIAATIAPHDALNPPADARPAG